MNRRLRIISGGQTGADIAGLRAARAVGIATGGWAPKGYMTERGPRPFVLGKMYGLEEHPDPRYPPRTLQNILTSDATLIFADNWEGGSKLTAKMCLKNQKPAMHLGVRELASSYPGDNAESVVECLHWLFKVKANRINIAGNRESKSPGIERAVFAFLVIVLTMYLREEPF